MPTSIYQERFIKRRKSEGLCITCGKPLDREGVNCRACRDKINQNNVLDRKFYQSHGICPECRRTPLMGDEKICLECSAKAYSRSLNRDRDHYNKVHNEWSRIEYRRRKEAGICTRCGKRKAENEISTCRLCREKDKGARRAREGYKPDRKERYKQGLCYWCDSPVKEGYKVCEKHYQMNVKKARSPKANEARSKIKKIEHVRISNELEAKKYEASK